MNKYQLFAFFHNFYRIFPIKKNKISFIGWPEANSPGIWDISNKNSRNGMIFITTSSSRTNTT